MNILYITNHLDIGGISSYLFYLGKALKGRGHQIYIASSSGEALSKFTEAGLNFIPIPIRTKCEVSPKIFASLSKLMPAVKQNRIQILHANTRTTQVLGYLLSRKAGIAYVSTCHGFFKKRLFRRLLPCWGKKVIAISEQVKEHLIRDFGVKEDDVRVVNNGIDIEKYKVLSTKEKGLRKKELGLGGGPVVGIVARLSDVKGHIYLIEAMKLVLEEMPSVKLLIVGEGRMEKQIKALAEKLNIKENIKFLASVSDTREVLAAMDVFVMPSLREGLGLALMEAQACGLAVVASDIGGIRSLVRHEHTGLLSAPADIRGLAVSILELLKHPQKAQMLGSNARDFICRNFSLNQMAVKTEEVYAECLNAKY